MVHHYLKNSILIVILLTSFTVNPLQAFKVTAQQELIQVSQNINENELLLRNLKEYQDLLNLKQKTQIQQLQQIQHNFNNSITSLYKMKHTPIQYLFSSDKSTSDIAVTYSLFNYYIQYLQSQLKENLEYLSIIQANKLKLKAINYKIRKTRLQLKKNKQTLYYYLHKKTTLSATSLKNIKKFNKNVVKNNYTLYELMNEINNSYILKADVQTEKDVLKNKGKFIAPSNGFLIQKYHQAKKNNLYYNGILILPQPSSQIVAPFDGEIVYSDKFYDYDSIIIIKHSVSYFSIITGKYNSFVKTTQLVKKHEPIAITADENTPIYYELQYKNKSINPTLWLSNNKTKNK